MQMTPELIEKRREIIADAIKQIEIGEHNIASMSYIYPINPHKRSQFFLDESSAQPKIDEIQSSCETCALGFMLISFVRLHNQLTVKDLVRSNSLLIKHFLHEYFDSNELGLIESIFENFRNSKFNLWIEEKERFAKKYPDPAKRLMAIFKSMMENNTALVLEHLFYS